MYKRITKGQSTPTELPAELTDKEIASMDGAGRANTNIAVYPTPVETLGQIDYALRFLNAKFYHTNVSSTDFDYASYEEYSITQEPSGEPQYLAVRNKKTGKSQAGLALSDSRAPIPFYSTAGIMINELAVEEES